MIKIKGFAAIGFQEDGSVVVYSFKHLSEAIDFLNSVKHVADLGWEIHELNNLDSVTVAVESFKRSIPEVEHE